jgi:hypothetical protein
MGISNELFHTEREENTRCQFKPTPNDTTNPSNKHLEILSDLEQLQITSGCSHHRSLLSDSREAPAPTFSRSKFFSEPASLPLKKPALRLANRGKNLGER